MESASIVQRLSLKRSPRPGQLEVLKRVTDGNKSELTIKLPTGYGKTFTAYASYHILRQSQRANRLLFVLPTDAQLRQLVDNCGGDDGDYAKSGLSGLRQVSDLRVYGAQALKQHRDGTHEVYAITIQALIAPRGNDTVSSMLRLGDWMIVFDEYHHYGDSGQWGIVAKSLPYQFRLAMSATPNRTKNDGIFGKPDVEIDYREAADGNHVKKLCGHAYNYRVDAIDEEGNPLSFTTEELVNEAGGDGDAIERLRISRKMRWSPKYISPLVTNPLERMQRDRIETGLNLRAVVGAMCVSHAEMVCKQVSSMFKDQFVVDWVGTGIDGRPDAENTRLINMFLAERDKDHIDVLVHVGMAGEGLDSTLVSEVIHLNKASLNNSNNQENGRAARFLSAVDGSPVVGNINFDSSSDYADYTGSAIMDAMDNNPPSNEEDEPEPRDPNEYKELPEEPAIELCNLELIGIDHGDEGVQRMANILIQNTKQFESADINDTEFLDFALKTYRAVRSHEAKEFNEESELAQRYEAVNSAMSTIAGLVIRLMAGDEGRVEKSLAGDVKKRINTRKKSSIGAVDKADVTNLKRHYSWLKGLEREILDGGLPGWLS